MESVRLRLRGRADRVQRIGPHLFEVRDFKTGATLEENGDIKEEIVLQLRAYGLMLLEQHPRAEVRLVVDDGCEREVSFDTRARRDAESKISALAKSMPASSVVSAMSLASPGRSCWSCPVRHICPAYQAAAPSWWRQYPEGIERISSDTWGEVLAVNITDTVDVVMRDHAGRRVRIARIDPRHGIDGQHVGDRLWLFGLDATGATRGFDGKRFHPRSFHELPRDRVERRAWVLQVFSQA
jgi:PD-(D/E)XK nuclease superfamily